MRGQWAKVGQGVCCSRCFREPTTCLRPQGFQGRGGVRNEGQGGKGMSRGRGGEDVRGMLFKMF